MQAGGKAGFDGRELSKPFSELKRGMRTVFNGFCSVARWDILAIDDDMGGRERGDTPHPGGYPCIGVLAGYVDRFPEMISFV
jgi:hypothetical protein